MQSPDNDWRILIGFDLSSDRYAVGFGNPARLGEQSDFAIQAIGVSAGFDLAMPRTARRDSNGLTERALRLETLDPQ